MEIESKHHNFILAGFAVIPVLEVTELLGYVVANYLVNKGVLYRAQSEEGERFERMAVAVSGDVLGAPM